MKKIFLFLFLLNNIKSFFLGPTAIGFGNTIISNSNVGVASVSLMGTMFGFGPILAITQASIATYNTIQKTPDLWTGLSTDSLFFALKRTKEVSRIFALNLAVASISSFLPFSLITSTLVTTIGAKIVRGYVNVNYEKEKLIKIIKILDEGLKNYFFITDFPTNTILEIFSLISPNCLKKTIPEGQLLLEENLIEKAFKKANDLGSKFKGYLQRDKKTKYYIFNEEEYYKKMIEFTKIIYSESTIQKISYHNSNNSPLIVLTLRELFKVPFLKESNIEFRIKKKSFLINTILESLDLRIELEEIEKKNNKEEEIESIKKKINETTFKTMDSFLLYNSMIVLDPTENDKEKLEESKKIVDAIEKRYQEKYKGKDLMTRDELNLYSEDMLKNIKSLAEFYENNLPIKRPFYIKEFQIQEKKELKEMVKSYPNNFISNLKGKKESVKSYIGEKIDNMGIKKTIRNIGSFFSRAKPLV